MKRCCLLVALSGCLFGPIEDGEIDSIGPGPTALADGSPAARAILTLVNDHVTSPEDLQSGLQPVSDRVAALLFESRPYFALAQLDAVPYVGSRVADALYLRAREAGLVAGEASIVASWRFTDALSGGSTPCPFGAQFVTLTASELDAAGDDTPVFELGKGCGPGAATFGPLRGGRYLVKVQANLGPDQPRLVSAATIVDLTDGDRRHDVTIAIPPP